MIRREAIRQHREGVIRLLHVQLGDLSRQLKKQIDKPLALAYCLWVIKLNLRNS